MDLALDVGDSDVRPSFADLDSATSGRAQRDYVVHDGESLWGDQPLPGNSMDLLAGAEETHGWFTWVRFTLRHDVPLHVHCRDDESIYVLDGEVTVRIGDRQYDLRAGSFIFMPKDVPHAITMRSTSWHGLSVTAPGGVLDGAMEDAITLRASGIKLTPEAVDAIQAQHGVKMLSVAGAFGR